MPSAMADLPDVNVWLALAWDGHLAHPVARVWWETAAREFVTPVSPI
jgi:hypothetical protein